VVLFAQPSYVHRFVVIVVVRLGFQASAHFAWLAFKLAALDLRVDIPPGDKLSTLASRGVVMPLSTICIQPFSMNFGFTRFAIIMIRQARVNFTERAALVLRVASELWRPSIAFISLTLAIVAILVIFGVWLHATPQAHRMSGQPPSADLSSAILARRIQSIAIPR
jgi:hypothetical protein